MTNAAIDELLADPPGVTPRIALRAYEETEDGAAGPWVFCPIPNQRGRYVRTHRCVVEVSCPQCGSVPGEPCKSRQTGDGYQVAVHCVRTVAAKELKGRAARRVRIDIVSPSEGWKALPLWRRCATCGEPVRGSWRGEDKPVWEHVDMATGARCAGSGSPWDELDECAAPCGTGGG